MKSLDNRVDASEVNACIVALSIRALYITDYTVRSLHAAFCYVKVRISVHFNLKLSEVIRVICYFNLYFLSLGTPFKLEIKRSGIYAVLKFLSYYIGVLSHIRVMDRSERHITFGINRTCRYYFISFLNLEAYDCDIYRLVLLIHKRSRGSVCILKPLLTYEYDIAFSVKSVVEYSVGL